MDGYVTLVCQVGALGVGRQVLWRVGISVGRRVVAAGQALLAEQHVALSAFVRPRHELVARLVRLAPEQTRVNVGLMGLEIPTRTEH